MTQPTHTAQVDVPVNDGRINLLQEQLVSWQWWNDFIDWWKSQLSQHNSKHSTEKLLVNGLVRI